MLITVDHNRNHLVNILLYYIFHHIVHYEINVNNRLLDINPMDHVLMYIHNYQIDIEHDYILDHIDYYFVLMNNYLSNMYRWLIEYFEYLQQEVHNKSRRNSVDIDKMLFLKEFTLEINKQKTFEI
jgi:hypothetical protein